MLASDGAGCLKIGYTEKLDLLEAFHEATSEFGEQSGALSFHGKKLNLGLTDMQCQIIINV